MKKHKHFKNRGFLYFSPEVEIYAVTKFWEMWISTVREEHGKTWVILAYLLVHQTPLKDQSWSDNKFSECFLRSYKWLHICIIWWLVDEDMAWKDYRSSRFIYLFIYLFIDFVTLWFVPKTESGWKVLSFFFGI